ncbi:MAG: AsmA-like C-terminal region-containing protein [Chthoniobacterales bacterium]|jgi:hypothetical protein
MPRFLRSGLIALGVVLLLVTGAVLAFNLHLQSAGMQEQLREGAKQTLGLPLSVRSTFYTPWDGIRLRGLVVPDMENAGVNFLEASEFQIVFKLWPLLHREFVVSRLALKRAVLTWRQNGDGQWRLPRRPEEAVALPGGTPAATATPAPAPTVGEGLTPPPPAPGFTVRVDSMEIERSRILFENRDGWPLLDADGINSNAEMHTDGGAKGEAAIPEAVLAGMLVARDLRSHFELTHGLITFPDIRCDVAGGQLTGHGSIATRAEGSPYDWALQLAGFQLSALKLPVSFGGTVMDGTMSADFALQGRNAPQRQIRGQMELNVDGGRLVPSAYLQGLGQVLGIRELQGMNFSEARATLRIEDDLIQVEPLRLRSEELAVEMTGPVTRTGGLDLQARLMLSPPVAARLAAITGRELPPTNDEALPGFRELPFRITGTLDAPQSDLAKRLLGDGLAGQVGNFLFNLIGTP